MTPGVFPIGVIEAESSKAAQRSFRDFASRWQGRVRIAGVIESPRPGREEGRGAGELHCLGSGAVFQLYHPEQCEGGGCGVDPHGAAMASHAVEGDIAAGCDLVILNKFGKLEAERAGLLSAFMAAIGAGVPVLTYVSAEYVREWARFADPLFCRLEDRPDAIDAWWKSHHQTHSGAGAVLPVSRA